MKKWYEIRNAASEVAEVYIYGDIGNWEGENSAIDFIRDLKKISSDVIAVYINSYGGDVFEGMAIYTAILKERQKGKVVSTYIDGIAASAASFIAMSGEIVYIARNAMIMIHNAWSVTGGDAKTHEHSSEMLKKIDSQIADIYAQKTGKNITAIKNMMDAETWMDADEAKSLGFIDEITEALKAAACVDPDSELWKQYKHVPNNLRIANTYSPPSFRQVGQVGSYGETGMGKDKMDKKLTLLNAANEPAALTAIANLQNDAATLRADNQALKAENEALKAKQSELNIDNLIATGKLLPAQKNFALSLNKTQLENFLKTVKPSNLGEVVDIQDGEGTAKVTYQTLMDDPALMEQYRKENLDLVEKLYNAYVEGGK